MKEKQRLNGITPKIVKMGIEKYEKSRQNQLRSMHVLHEGGLLSKQKYTNSRNSSDVTKHVPDKLCRNDKTLFMEGCEISKILPYITLIVI